MTTWWDRTPRTASVKPQPMESLGTLNGSHVLVWPARTSSNALSMKWSAHPAAYAWKYVRARSRSRVLDHLGIFHSNVTGPLVAVLGRLMTTLVPVDFT